MKKFFFIYFFSILISGCANYVDDNVYKLEKLSGYDIPVCVNYIKKEKVAGSIDIGGINRHKIKDDSDLERNMEISKIVPYTYCLNRLPKQVHLVEKKENDMTICYDRNNHVKLPILYCQKDMNVSVSVSTEVSQKVIFH